MDSNTCKQKFVKLINVFLPLNTRRRAIMSFVYKTVRNPRAILRKLTLRRLIKSVVYLLTEDRQKFRQRMERFFAADGAPKNDTISQFKTYDPRGKTLIFNIDKQPAVSIIIPAYNQWEYTYSCLYSILENTKDIPYEIIVADDVSIDETRNIDKYVQNITVIRNKENKGFLHNCNSASSKARGKYILFLNNDTNVQHNWLKPLVKLMECDKEIGMVGSKLVFCDGRLQEAGGIIWKDASGCNYGRLDDPQKPEYSYVKEVDYISGASIMIRADLWRQIGGFDEQYTPAYYEDTDLAFELRRRGYKVVYQPQSVVIHFEGISHGTDVSTGIKSYQVSNREKFLKKWEGILNNEHQSPNENFFWARDRSSRKKTLLVIDHTIPTHDKDAGSRTMYQYLKLFVKQGLNIKFYGHNFYSVNQAYVENLQQLGMEVLYGDNNSDYFQNWLRENGRFIDYVYLHKPEPASIYIDLVKKHTDSKVIYNVADLHWVRLERQYELDKDMRTLSSAELHKEMEFKVFKESDVILTYSDYEKNILDKEFPDKKTVVQPLFIYDEQFPLGISKPGTEREYITFVGGFLHKPNADGVIWFIKNVWPIIKKEVPQAKVKIIGSNPPDEIIKLNSETIEVPGYVSDQQLEEYYSKTKVIVAPLRFGAGVKGKVIEAVAYGIPVVTTEVGAEGILERDKVLCVQDDEKAFASEVITLMTNEEKWRKKHASCIEYAGKYFSTRGAAEIIVSDILN